MILALIGVIGSLASKKLRARWPFFFGFFVFSFLAVCPGFYFRPHYFILFAPALALAAGVGLVMIGRGMAPKIPLPVTAVSLVVLVIISFGFPFIVGSGLYFKMLPESVSRAVYGRNPFPEARRIGEYIKEHSKEGDRLLVFGSEPQIYFYSGLKAATGFMYTYALMEKHPYARDMQKDMASEVEFADPRYVVQVSVPMSWLVKRGSDPFIFKWAEQYLKGRYRIVGWADILPAGETRYVFGADAADYKPESRFWLAIYEKNSE